MYAATCPSEPPPSGLASIRVTGAVEARFAIGHRGTRIADLSETGGFRLKFPEQERDECEAVLVNTGGGLTGGDRFQLDVTAKKAATLLITTQSAEKIYRSSGPETTLDTRLTLAEGASLAFLPQETILFSGARLRRVLAVDMAEDARLLAAESVIFGRSAMGEVLASGSFRDRWRIRRDGKLIFAEDVRLDGSMHETLKRKAIGDGARAIATILYAAPEAEARLDAIRDHLSAAQCETGAGAFPGLLIVRIPRQGCRTTATRPCRLPSVSARCAAAEGVAMLRVARLSQLRDLALGRMEDLVSRGRCEVKDGPQGRRLWRLQVLDLDRPSKDTLPYERRRSLPKGLRYLRVVGR